MAKKAQAQSRPTNGLPLFLAGIFVCFWSVLLIWKTTQAFPWTWNNILLAFDLQRAGVFTASGFFSQWAKHILNLFWLSALLVTALAVGHKCLTAWFTTPDAKLDTVLYAGGLGLAAISLTVFFLATIGCLYPLVFRFGLLAACGWSVWTLWPIRSQFMPKRGWLLGNTTWLERGLGLVVLGCLGMVILFAGSPEIFFDSLVYHLANPNSWIQSHGFKPLPYNFFSNFPMGIEMLYTGALLLTDERLCRMIHVVLGVLAALAVFSLGRRWFGKRAGFWSMGIFITTPVVVMNMHSSGVDVGAAFFSILAFMAIAEWAMGEGQTRRLVLAGILVGMAMACKYNTAFILGPASLIAAGIRYTRERSFPAITKQLLIFGVAALALLLPWFIKNTVYTGNPVCPFLFKIIPTKYIHPEKMQQQMDGFQEFGQRTFKQFMLQPWDLTFFQATSNSYIGTIYLLLLPGMILLVVLWRRGPPVLHLLLLGSLVACVIWSTQTRITRYLIPTLPLLAVLGAYVLERCHAWHKVLGSVLRLTVVFLAAWGLALTLYINLPSADAAAVFMGLESRDAYLDRKLMSSYTSMARTFNRLPGAVKVLVVGETRAYYFKKPAIAATVYDYDPFIQSLSTAPDAETVWKQWRDQGYTHVFISQQEAVRVRGYEKYQWDAPALDRLRQLLARYLRPIASGNQQDLYEIASAPMLDSPIKLGRPLFTYDPEVLNKVLEHYNRIAQAMQTGQDQDLRAVWMRMRELAPEWEVPYIGLGWYYLRNNQKAEAYEMYQQADRLAWLDSGSYNNLGVLYMEQGQLLEAKRCFQLAVTRDPNNETTRKNLEVVERAVIQAGGKK